MCFWKVKIGFPVFYFGWLFEKNCGIHRVRHVWARALVLLTIGVSWNHVWVGGVAMCKQIVGSSVRDKASWEVDPELERRSQRT